MEKKQSNDVKYRAKAAYKDKTEVATYDAYRFKSLKGRITDTLEKRAILKALARIPHGGRVLDIPCGTGRITQFLLELGYRVVGADVSQEMIGLARPRLEDYPNLEALQEADAEKLPYGDGEFDAVTSIRLMNHVPPDIRVQMLREMARVSKGAVIISHCNPRSISALKRRIKMFFRPTNAPWNPATYAMARLEAESAGLVIEAVYPILGRVSETNIYLLKK